jgi:hypothetical protein
MTQPQDYQRDFYDQEQSLLQTSPLEADNWENRFIPVPCTTIVTQHQYSPTKPAWENYWGTTKVHPARYWINESICQWIHNPFALHGWIFVNVTTQDIYRGSRAPPPPFQEGYTVRWAKGSRSWRADKVSETAESGSSSPSTPAWMRRWTTRPYASFVLDGKEVEWVSMPLNWQYTVLIEVATGELVKSVDAPPTPLGKTAVQTSRRYWRLV